MSASPSMIGRSADASNRPEVSSIVRMVALLCRRWKVLAIAGLIAGGLAALFVMTRPRTYLSQATIEVGPDTPLVGSDGVGGSVSRSSPMWENHLKTQESLLRRPGLLAAVIDDLPEEAAEPYLDERDPAQALAKDLEIDAVPSTFLISIALRHARPEHGPVIVNKLVEHFIGDSNRRLTELKNGALDVLSKESLPVIKQRMDEADQSLRAFQSKVGFGDLGEQYAELLAEKRRLNERRVALKLRALALRSGPAPASDGPEGRDVTWAALEAKRVELEMELALKKTELRDRHPAILSLQTRLDGLKRMLQEVADAQLKRLEAEERSFREEEALLAGRIAEARALLDQYKNLDLEVAASRDLYHSYLKRQGEVKAISGAGLTSVRVVDRARIPRQEGPKFQLALALALVIGLPFGLLAVFAAEHIDDRVPTPHEAEAALDLDLLSVVPVLPTTAGSAHLPVVPEDDPVTAPLEPFRRLRAELASKLRGVEGCRIVAVISADYGEGKSTVAINLARVLALEGKRVLLFDLDLRQPGLKNFLGDSQSPGLEAYLKDGASLDRCLQPGRIPGVDVFGPAGEFAGSAEVTGTSKFRSVWAALRSSYDYVIVDTSPINVVAEAAVVAAHVDASVFVMEERRTSIRHAKAALRRLGNHRAYSAGLVVNRSQAFDFDRPDPDRVRPDWDRANGRAPEPAPLEVSVNSSGPRAWGEVLVSTRYLRFIPRWLGKLGPMWRRTRRALRS